jgi:gentisate 1,2-dioxygenase
MTSDLMYEYTSAANPKLSKIPILFHRSNLYKEGKTRIIPFDNSKYLHTFYPSTTPSLLASFVKILKNENIHTQANATSHFFYFIEGKGYSLISSNKIQNWGKGDIFVVPPSDKYITHC